MIALESVLRRIVVELNEAHVSFALVGGLAVSIRTEPRFTKDADLAVAVTSDAEAEALVRHLTNLEYRVAAIVEQEAAGRLVTVRLSTADQKKAPVIDLLLASSGIETEIVAEAEPVEVVLGLTLGVARIGHLLALKVLARDDVRRPLDIGDLRALLRVASDVELARARRARVDCGAGLSSRPQPDGRVRRLAFAPRLGHRPRENKGGPPRAGRA